MECPCCGVEFDNEQQLRRHLAERRQDVADALAAMNEGEDESDEDQGEGEDDEDEYDEDEDEPANLNNELAPPAEDIEPAPAPAPARRGNIDLAALIAREGDDDPPPAELDHLDDWDDFSDFDKMDLDDGDNLFAPLPDVAPGLDVLRNPRVGINDWDNEDELEGIEQPEPEVDDISVGSDEQDPEFEEDDGIRGVDPNAEPDMDQEELRGYLRQQFGERGEQEWLDIFERFLTDEDRLTLRFLSVRQRTHLSRAMYEDLREYACKDLGLPSDFCAWARLKFLSNLNSRSYDCCINSCVCFLGKYEDLDACPFCRSPRYNAAGKPRRVFNYTPLIPQLIGLFQNADSVKQMRRRALHEELRVQEPDILDDVFDGEIYRTLRQTQVREGHEYRYFDYPDDIALGLGTDGFTMYKRWRKKGTSAAWPLILVNYNLHPSIRTKLENIICVGVVPGPKECKDINSFLVPLIEELLELAGGVEASKVASDVDDFIGDGTQFVLHAFLIILFGDIPAISKLLMLRGHGAITPCRTCLIQGMEYRTRNNLGRDHVVYYVPLRAPGNGAAPPEILMPRSHETFLEHYAQLDDARRVGERTRISKQCGLNGKPVLARLGSIDLSSCAPYELMHLIFENLVPNMISLWKGTFKGIDADEIQPYHISAADWEDIGQFTVEANRTIPAQFIGTLPNIDTDPGLFKAEAHSFWFVHLAPILLNGRLDQEYYEHFLAMREILFWCFELEITNAQIDALEEMINHWVEEYERLYYQYEYRRLPTCVLTIHALLHIPHYIRQTGPLSGTWSFVMERFCGYLLRPALSNRVRPYEYLDNFIRRRAQLQIVARVNNMPGLLRSIPNLTREFGELISSQEKIWDFLPGFILGQPRRARYPATAQLKRQICRYFSLAEARPGPVRWTSRELHERVDWESLIRYGRFRMASMGDRVRTANLVDREPAARDNSYIRYELLPDRNVRNYRPDQAMRVIYYGRVLDVFYVQWIRNLDTGYRQPYLLARVQECNTRGLDATLPANPIVWYNRLDPPEVINLGSVQAAVGRIKIGGRHTYAIIDRSRGARTVFNGEDGNPDPDLN